jgi:surface polysaccharide O-acyltransferase-like enzyme
LSKPAVPLFLMVSGALLLKRPQTIQKTFKRVWRVLVILVIFSIIYYLVFTANDAWSFSGFFAAFLNGEITTPLWYLYMYAAMLLLTPVLSLLVQNMSVKIFAYLAVLVLFANGAVPLIEHYSGLSISNDFTAPFFSVYIVIYLGGYYLHSSDSAWLKQRSVILGAAVIGIVLLALLVVGTYAQFAAGGIAATRLLDNPQNILIAPLAFIIFYLCKSAFSDRELPRIADFIISPMGACTFGVYLFHMYALFRLSDWLYIMAGVIPPLLAAIVFQVFLLVLCTIPTYLLRKIPIVEKYL